MLVRIIKQFSYKGKTISPSDEPIDFPAVDAVQLIEGRVAVPVRSTPVETQVVESPPERAVAEAKSPTKPKRGRRKAKS